MKWKRCYGLEDWTFADDGRMRKRQMSGNDIEINEAGERLPLMISTIPAFGETQVSFCVATDPQLERWFKDGVDVNDVEISEAHW
jgi:hypothetical protein